MRESVKKALRFLLLLILQLAFFIYFSPLAK